MKDDVNRYTTLIDIKCVGLSAEQDLSQFWSVFRIDIVIFQEEFLLGKCN